ncbi:glycylpeptide N-tetradecanoyltransferase [Pancytospora philotis]|nr:glycylpeptide N-tetradecanoyltransferase [Pancytospora philotis]
MGHGFWNTQPVGLGAGGAGEPKQATERVKLPAGLAWDEVADIAEITEFLKQNYVEDSDAQLRFQYSGAFFQYLFGDPEHKSAYSLGVRSGERLVGYLLAKAHSLTIDGAAKRVVSVNFLCLSREYRSKSIAPLLISEITRIANGYGIFQGVFTGPSDLGFAVAGTTYHHLFLDPVKLYACGYAENLVVDSHDYAVREGTRLAADADMGTLHGLYAGSSQQYRIFESFSEPLFAHVFKNRPGIFHTLYNAEHQEFASVFLIDTLCLENGESFTTAYLYYWHGSPAIVRDAACYARANGVALFNALDLASNGPLIRPLKMLEGSGHLEYHLFNWPTGKIATSDLNFILF